VREEKSEKMSWTSDDVFDDEMMAAAEWVERGL
jgi:hypothetical protein